MEIVLLDVTADGKEIKLNHWNILKYMTYWRNKGFKI